MKQFEIDKLVDDIQDYLNSVEKPGVGANGVDKISQTGREAGLFISIKSREKMKRFLKFSKYACHAVEALTIGLLTTVILGPFGGWPQMVTLVIGTLLLSIFAVTVLLGMQARIRLLLQIESNTQRIAASKARIAEALEKLRLE